MPSFRERLRKIARLADAALDDSIENTVCKNRCLRVSHELMIIIRLGLKSDIKAIEYLRLLLGVEPTDEEFQDSNLVCHTVIEQYYCTLWTYAVNPIQDPLIVPELRSEGLNACAAVVHTVKYMFTPPKKKPIQLTGVGPLIQRERLRQSFRIVGGTAVSSPTR